MSNQEFKDQLRVLMRPDESLRPFVCKGNPLQSEIFIVGINPATNMKSSFWDYYKEDEFDKEKWLNDYKHSREGKRTVLSPTRKKIEYLVYAIFKGYQCLETNVFSAPSRNLKALDNSLKSTDILSFLIGEIKPKAIFIHGKNPTEYIRKEFDIIFRPSVPIIIKYDEKYVIRPTLLDCEYGKVAICASKHLTRIAQSEITEVANELIRLL